MEESEDHHQTDSSSESGDDETNLKEEERLQCVKNYQDQIKLNELDYEAHIGLISTLRDLGEFDELRKARLHMNKIYPLSSDLWMEWLSDEQKICVKDEEKVFIISLFEKAVHEYTSVKVWVEYIMFMLGCGNIEETRNVYEKALMAVGIHLSEGILIWQAVILVELQVFANIVPTEEESKIEEQKKRIQNLYRRHARVPLMNLDKTEFLCDASKWFENEKVDPNIKRDLEKSYKKMTEYVKYEEALICAKEEMEKLEAYRKYIDVVSNDENPALIQNIYERTVSDLCLNAGLWEEYVRFLMEQFPSADYIILPVCERGQRNCPWSGALCELHILALEKFSDVLGHADIECKIKASLQNIISSGVTVGAEMVKAWMAYLVYLRRKIIWSETHDDQLTLFRNACEEAMESIEKSFGEEGDLECDVARFYGRVEAESARNIEGARKIWNDLIMKKNRNSKNANFWLEYINLERSFGTTNYCRKLLRRALERNWDWVEVIGTAFLRFEQELGTLETMCDFESRYRDRLAIVQKKRLEDAAKKEKESVESVSRPQKGKSSQSHLPVSTNNEISDRNFKKPAPVKKSPVKGAKIAVKPVSEVTPPPGYKRPAVEDAENEAKRQKVDQTFGKFIKHDSSIDSRTVFLSNLDYSAEEKDILPIFSECGDVTNLRISRDFQGRSKGFAYLTFESQELAEKALKLDRKPIDKRPVFISRCNPREREHAFKYSTGLEKNKLFVRGLAKSLKENDVKEAFEPHGEIKSIRLITHRNGFSKGSCYIEYNNAATAENVLQKMDGAVLNGSKISVMFSNPSAAKLSKADPVINPRPGPSQAPSQRPKLSLLPRSLLRNSAKPEQPSLNGRNSHSDEKQLSEPKSNDDFRKLLSK